MKKDDRGHVRIWVAVVSIAILLPVISVLLGYWLWNISLPTLMFISFVLLFIGSMACWPAVDRQATSSEGLILLIIGQASGVGVLILFFIRVFAQGFLFHWM